MRWMQDLRTKKEVEYLAEFTVNLGLEVIVFEEVNTRSNNPPKSSTKPYNWFRTRMEEDGYKFAEGKSGGTQNIVIAWKEDVIQLDRKSVV